MRRAIPWKVGQRVQWRQGTTMLTGYATSIDGRTGFPPAHVRGDDGRTYKPPAAAYTSITVDPVCRAVERPTSSLALRARRRFTTLSELP